jgi:uncharacterized membrane-anchored protein
MVNEDFGNRMRKMELEMAKFKVEMNNLTKTVDGMSTKLDNLCTAVIGDGTQNRGIISRIQSVEDTLNSIKEKNSENREEDRNKNNTWKWIVGTIIGILSMVSGYLAFFR